MKTVYTHCFIITGKENKEVLEDMNIFVEGTKIVKISQDMPTDDDQIIECRHMYVIPGMINLHMHLFGTGKPSKELAGGGHQQTILCLVKKFPGSLILDHLVETHLKEALYSGVTTARAVGDFYYSDVRARDKINNGKIKGPRLFVSGPAITVPSGHGAGTFADVATTKEEFEQLVVERKNNNVDFIKICTTGGVMDAKVKGEPGVLKMNLEQTKAVCDKAHELGMIVASHCESQEGVEVALKGGVDTIEHGSTMNEEIIKLFKSNPSALITTISPALPLAKLDYHMTMLDEMAVYNSNVVFEGIIDGAKEALKEGITVGLGTDASCPFITPYDTYRELCYFHNYLDMDPYDVIVHASLINAKVLGIDHITGSIEEGKDADFVLVDGNPLEDLAILSFPKCVVKQGIVYKNIQIKKNLDIENALNPFLEKQEA